MGRLLLLEKLSCDVLEHLLEFLLASFLQSLFSRGLLLQLNLHRCGALSSLLILLDKVLLHDGLCIQFFLGFATIESVADVDLLVAL